MKSLSDLHNCEKSEGKIVCITLDKLGVERCSYCGTPVKYSQWFRENHPEFFDVGKTNES